MRRIATIAAVAAAGAVASSPAAARPIDPPVDRGDRFDFPMPPLPKHQGQGGYTRDLLFRTVLPGPPTWPVDPEPLTRPADAAPVTDEDRSGWLLAGIGIAGAGIAAGGAAGVARRYRIRARRLAV